MATRKEERKADRFNAAVLKTRFPDVESLKKEVNEYFEDVESRVETRPIMNAKPDRDGVVPTEVVKLPYTHAGLAAYLGIGLKDLNMMSVDEEWSYVHKYLDYFSARVESRMIDLGYLQRGNEKIFDAVVKNRVGYSDKVDIRSQHMSINLTFIRAPEDRALAKELLENTAKTRVADAKRAVVKVNELKSLDVPKELVKPKPEIDGEPEPKKRGRPSNAELERRKLTEAEIVEDGHA